MDKDFRDRIARYVDKIGVKRANDIATAILSETPAKIGKFNDIDAIVAEMKAQLSVLEYLHCDSDIVEKYTKYLP